MEARLTANAFAKLLDCLSADRERAGEKYEDLRRTLIRFFEWRGAPFPEEHADETFNRIAFEEGKMWSAPAERSGDGAFGSL
jgi:hypothetical protein